MKIWKEFKEFAFKGNVINLAVGVVIGNAFGKITTSLVNDIIMPIFGWMTAGVQFSSLGAYHAYLTLRYAFYITLFGQGWGMLLEALVFLAVLVSCLVILAGQIRGLPPKKAPAAL